MMRNCSYVLAALAVALLIAVSVPAQATIIHTDTAFPDPDDLGSVGSTPFPFVGPGGKDDTTPFGPGFYEMPGDPGGDDGDAWNWTTTDWSSITLAAST